MKLRPAFLALLMGVSTLAVGQNFSGGVFTGLNASRIQNDGYSRFQKLGLHGGAFVQREFAENLGWKMELRYTSRGMYHHPTPALPFIQLSKLTYLELPLSVTYLYNKKVELELGLAPDVLLAEYYEDENGPLDPSYSSDLRRFGLNGFAGVSYYLIDRVAIGLRYTNSAIPFYPFDYWTPRYFASGYFHNVVSVGIKYYILK